MKRSMKIRLYLLTATLVLVGAIIWLISGAQCHPSRLPTDGAVEQQEMQRGFTNQRSEGYVSSCQSSLDAPSSALTSHFQTVLTQSQNVHLDPEIAQASLEFKQNSNLGLRPRPAKKLIPYLKKGMSKSEVKSMLGDPSRISNDGLFWGYIVMYSQYIDVYFDKRDRVTRVDACVSTNASDRRAGVAAGE